MNFRLLKPIINQEETQTETIRRMIIEYVKKEPQLYYSRKQLEIYLKTKMASVNSQYLTEALKIISRTGLLIRCEHPELKDLRSTWYACYSSLIEQ